MRRVKPVLVLWRDCYGSSETWKEASDPPDPAIVVRTVGWPLKKYKKGYLVLADSWFKRGKDLVYGQLTYIPEGMVVSITKLD